MRTEQIQIYKFEELKPEIQKKVIQKFIEREQNDNWWVEDLQRSFKENAEEEGIEKPDLEWKVGYHNNLNFTKGFINLGTFFEKNKLMKRFGWILQLDNMEADFSLNKDGQIESSYNEMTKGQEKALDKLKDIIQNKIDELESKFLKWANAENDYRQSEECIKGNIEANDYEFYDNGEIAN